MKRPEGKPPTNPAKAAKIEQNMDTIARLRDENLQLELEIKLERMSGKVVCLDDYRATRAMLKRYKPTAVSWATG